MMDPAGVYIDIGVHMRLSFFPGLSFCHVVKDNLIEFFLSGYIRDIENHGEFVS